MSSLLQTMISSGQEVHRNTVPFKEAKKLNNLRTLDEV